MSVPGRGFPPAGRQSGSAALPRALLFGAGMLCVILAVSALAPLVAPYDPSSQDLSSSLQGPSRDHWLGTDQLGRDLLTRLMYAGRTDLSIMVLAQVIPFCAGVFLGLLAGYYGGAIDAAVMLLTDTVIAFPFYLIVVVVAFATGSGQRGIYLTFALVGWIVYARVVRGLCSTFRRLEWVAAARILGYGDARIIAFHVLPNVLPQAVIVLMSDMVKLLVAIVTLGYLGIGIEPPTPDWGTMIAEGRPFMATRWWLSALPGLAVVYSGIALSLVGDGLADLWRRR